MSRAPLAPLNALPLDYVPPSQNARPGLITAIGVISIVVAVLSGLTSLSYGFGSLGFLMMSRVKMPMTTANVTTANVRVQAGPGRASVSVLAVGPRGLQPADRRIVIDGVTRDSVLSEARTKMLDALLAESGSDVLSFSGSALTAQAVASSVSDSGRLADLNGKPGPDFFVLGAGRIELYDDHAVFLPSNGAEPTRIGEADISDGGTALTSADIQNVIDKMQSMSGNKLNAAQIATLRTQLQGPGAGLVDKSKRIPPTSQVTGSFVQPDGSAMIHTINGMVIVDTNGVVTSSMLTGAMFVGGAAPFNVSVPAAILLIAASLLSLGLAIYLLVIGILTLRQSLRGRQLHWIYVWLKIPVSVVAIVAVFWIARSFAATLGTMPGAPPQQSVAFFAGLFYAAFIGLGLIYPIALIFALRSRRVREYYAGVQ